MGEMEISIMMHVVCQSYCQLMLKEIYLTTGAGRVEKGETVNLDFQQKKL